MVRARVFFSGTVQGVGFRYTCRSYAADLGLTGWVRNLADGRVELLAEGSQDVIDQLIESIEKHFDGYIRSKDVDYQDATGTFSDFRIAF
jgi:acylphosphatase